MGLGNDLKAEVNKILKAKWESRDGRVVPSSDDLKLANDAIKLEGTVLYADLSGSTSLVNDYKPWFAAEVYKSYLHCAAKIVRSEGGHITSYDGDRIMAVFIGDSKNTSAARTALKLNYCVKKIITPAIQEQYPDTPYAVGQVAGIDTSPLFVARTGIRGANDLVWVGRAANYAAKLSTLSPDYPSRITADVFDRLAKEAKMGVDGREMWKQARWTDMGDMTIYRSTWWWSLT